MQTAIIVEISKLERFRNSFYYNLKYELLGNIYNVEYFSETDELTKGDIIYV